METPLVAPAAPNAPSLPAPPLLFTVADKVHLARGLDFIFAGLLVTIVSVADLLMAIIPRMFSTLIGAGGLIAVLVGAMQIQRVCGLGASWQCRARWFLISALATAYLFPFFHFWRHLPRNLYFCGHGLAFFVAFILAMVMLAWTIHALAATFGRRMLAWQAVLSIGALVLVQGVPFFLLASKLFVLAQHGDDPLILLQLFLSAIHPLWISAWLLPFTLTLSLAWEAKEIVLAQLLEKQD
jgi:hypothetical protein